MTTELDLALALAEKLSVPCPGENHRFRMGTDARTEAYFCITHTGCLTSPCDGTGRIWPLREPCPNSRCQAGKIRSTLTANIYFHKTCASRGWVPKEAPLEVLMEWCRKEGRFHNISFGFWNDEVDCILTPEGIAVGDETEKERGWGLDCLAALVAALCKTLVLVKEEEP